MTNWIYKSVLPFFPAYANGTLRGWRRLLVRLWLGADPRAREALKGLRHVQRAVREQDLPHPSPAAWQGIRARLAGRPQSQPSHHRRQTNPVLVGISMGLLAMIAAFFWNTLPPGIVLEWSTEGLTPVTFNVYRAPETGDGVPADLEFALLEQVPAAADHSAYRFTDLQLLPGESYVYRVDALGSNGQLFTSEVVPGNALQALPGQLALVIVVIGFGLSLATLLRQPHSLRQKIFAL